MTQILQFLNKNFNKKLKNIITLTYIYIIKYLQNTQNTSLYYIYIIKYLQNTHNTLLYIYILLNNHKTHKLQVNTPPNF